MCMQYPLLPLYFSSPTYKVGHKKRDKSKDTFSKEIIVSFSISADLYSKPVSFIWYQDGPPRAVFGGREDKDYFAAKSPTFVQRHHWREYPGKKILHSEDFQHVGEVVRWPKTWSAHSDGSPPHRWRENSPKVEGRSQHAHLSSGQTRSVVLFPWVSAWSISTL